LFGEESTAGWWLIGQTNRLQLFQQFFHFSFFTLQITPTPSTFPPHIHCIVGPTHHTLQKSSWSRCQFLLCRALHPPLSLELPALPYFRCRAPLPQLSVLPAPALAPFSRCRPQLGRQRVPGTTGKWRMELADVCPARRRKKKREEQNRCTSLRRCYGQRNRGGTYLTTVANRVGDGGQLGSRSSHDGYGARARCCAEGQGGGRGSKDGRMGELARRRWRAKSLLMFGERRGDDCERDCKLRQTTRFSLIFPFLQINV
jgi:hypothetical protein